MAPPHLYLEKTSEGYGVFAHEEIQQGSIVVDYVGNTEYKSKSLYAIELYDGKKIRNLGPMINDGFPNCVHVPMGQIKGLPVLHVLVAIRTLKVGEQILWSYGAHHPIKIDKYINFAMKESEEWFKNSEPMVGYSKYIDSIKNLQETIQARTEISYLQYLVTTPSVLLILILKKIITIEQIGLLTKQHYFVRAQDENKLKRVKLILFLANLLLVLFPEKQARETLIKKIEFLFSHFPVSTVIRYLATFTEDEDSKKALKNIVMRSSNEETKNMLQSGLNQKLLVDLTKYEFI